MHRASVASRVEEDFSELEAEKCMQFQWWVECVYLLFRLSTEEHIEDSALETIQWTWMRFMSSLDFSTMFQDSSLSLLSNLNF